ncbi:hypothetical protein GOBAR_AA27528 [Gossypium barbadense]|uniref:Uncharacterized protein n=1 Tax=Gossypium barbadense TaxID=3634 RepID=A0A2P5WPW8_GOSBA|nr:hypothetical protein GOBAR_AA27528 [Gossypium barbadense]
MKAPTSNLEVELAPFVLASGPLRQYGLERPSELEFKWIGGLSSSRARTKELMGDILLRWTYPTRCRKSAVGATSKGKHFEVSKALKALDGLEIEMSTRHNKAEEIASNKDDGKSDYGLGLGRSKGRGYYANRQ